MRSQKGISLISLTVYIIGMTIAVAAVTVISSYFYKNVDVTLKDINPVTEYNKFTGFFSEEINSENIYVRESSSNINDDQNYIVFSNDVQYTFVKANKSIYRNKIKICRNVNTCEFNYKKDEKTVSVTLQIGNDEPQSISYKIKN